MKELIKERAFPTIGVILLGGISDELKRYPRHTSAGFAYTSLSSNICTETSIVMSDEKVGTLDDVEVGDSYRSPFRILEKYSPFFEKVADLNGNRLGFISRNRDILSGSSDSGAAALGSAISRIGGESIDKVELENDLRMISESVGRSLHGGLTLTEIRNGIPVTERLLGPEKFQDYVVVGCRFKEKRKPSDLIHANIVKSPVYSERVQRTSEKGSLLRKFSEEENIESIFELAQNDTDEYHSLIESVGVNIINSSMRKFIAHLHELAKKVWCTYIVTGGTNVFVIVHRENSQAVADEAVRFDSDPVILKVAGSPQNLFSLSD